MSFVDCINTAITDGKVSEKRGKEAIDAYNAHVAANELTGVSGSAAHNGAAFAAVDTLSKANHARKWALLNQLKRQHEISQTISSTKDIGLDLLKFMDRQQTIIDRLRGDLLAPLYTFVEKYKPQFAGLWHTVEHLDDIVHESFGEGSHTPEVKALTKGIQDFLENMRKRGNIEGASTPPNPNYRLPQSHEALLINKLNPDRHIAGQEWVGDMIQHGDFDLIQYAGKPILPQDRPSILTRIVEGIQTDGKIHQKVGVPDHGGLVNRLNQERFLYFKNAESYLFMQNKYSSKNLVEHLIGLAESRAHDIALMETMGPNPYATRDYMHGLANKRAGELELENKGSKRRVTSTVEKDLRTFDDRFAYHSMNIDTAPESLPIQTVNTVKTLVITAVLKNLFVAQLTDRMFSGYAARRFKLPGMNISSQWLRQFNPLNKADRLDLMASGIANESAIAAGHSSHRFFGAQDGAKFARRFSDVAYRVALVTPQNQATRNANAFELFKVWANSAHLKYNELPMSSVFRERGITEGDWDTFRATPKFTPESSKGSWWKTGPQWLRPGDLASSGKISDQRIADKFSDFLHAHQRIAVPRTGSREAVTFGGAYPAETALGQLGRTVGTLKNFPLTMYHTYWADIRYADMPLPDKIKLTAQFMVYMMGAGVMLTQTQSLLNGYGLYNPAEMDLGQNLDFAGKVLINAGILGPLGDMVYGTLQGGGDRGSFASSLLGPLPAFAYDTGALTAGNFTQLVQGKDPHFQAEAIKYISKYMPQTWYVHLLLEREFFDELLRQSDPAAYNRKVQYMQKTAQDSGRDIIYPMH